MELFLATVCTHEWNRCQDAGRSFAEGARLLKAERPDQAELVDAYGIRFDEMIAGPIGGSSAARRYLASPIGRLRPIRRRCRGLSFSAGFGEFWFRARSA